MASMAKCGAGAHHQKLAQVPVAHLGDAPEPLLAPVELWRGVKPRKAANSRPLAKTLASWIVAVIAEAVTGPMPGIVVNRLAVSLDLTDAASSLSIAPIASSSVSI